MTRAVNNLIWSIALLVGAVILAKKDEAAVPWAIGVVAVIVGTFATIAVLMEHEKI